MFRQRQFSEENSDKLKIWRRRNSSQHSATLSLLFYATGQSRVIKRSRKDAYSIAAAVTSRTLLVAGEERRKTVRTHKAAPRRRHDIKCCNGRCSHRKWGGRGDRESSSYRPSSCAMTSYRSSCSIGGKMLEIGTAQLKRCLLLT